jgi:hypothetical protein
MRPCKCARYGLPRASLCAHGAPTQSLPKTPGLLWLGLSAFEITLQSLKAAPLESGHTAGQQNTESQSRQVCMREIVSWHSLPPNGQQSILRALGCKRPKFPRVLAQAWEKPLKPRRTRWCSSSRATHVGSLLVGIGSPYNNVKVEKWHF